jgi:hypothetical protein
MKIFAEGKVLITIQARIASNIERDKICFLYRRIRTPESTTVLNVYEFVHKKPEDTPVCI